MKKPLGTSTIIAVVILAIATGAICGLSAGGFSVHGLTTFFIATLVAWVIYALIARAMTK